MSVLFILVGLVGLLLGGEALVRGAVSIAERFRISPMVIGVTLVGFGTSTPELVTSLQAAFAGAPGIAVGNVIGSNIANILLILGGAAALSPIVVKAHEFRRDGAALVVGTLIGTALILTGQIGLVGGGLLVAALIAYLVFTLANGAQEDAPEDTVAMHPGLAALFVIGGLAITIFSAGLLVDGAVDIAARLGVSEAVIGLTIVAVGTSLPELVTSIAAARKGQSALALGNVLGSNLFNLLGILGITALVHPLEVPAEILAFDIWVMLAATAALCLVAITGWRVTRGEGVALVAAYAAYLAALVPLA